MTRIAVIAARVLLGLIFFVFGLNFFFHFIPMPASQPPAALAFGTALAETGYMMTMVKVMEVAVGVLLLANRFVPLALALVTPILVNIVAFHAFLTPPSTLGLPVVMLALHLFLAWQYRRAYLPMLQAKTAVAADEARASSTLTPVAG